MNAVAANGRDARRAVAIVVHDVAPQTWPQCARLLKMIDDLDARPLTLLVVPQYHHRGSMMRDKRFVAALERRLAGGDELALHGLHHRDDAPAPHTVVGFVKRRLLTRAEGEFAALDERGAGWRLSRGIEAFEALRWPLYGFVPPAWLLSASSRRAIDRCGYPFRYVSARRVIYRMPQWSPHRTANLCYSPDARWRRAMSRALIRFELAYGKRLPLLRISLHPQDARFPQVVEHWQALIVAALRERVPMTKERWVSSLHGTEQSTREAWHGAA